MAREKKPIHEVEMTEGKREIIQKLLQEYEFSQHWIYRKLSKICLAEQSRK